MTALGKYANNPSTAGHRAEARERWYGLRAALWTRSSLPRVRKCGRCRRTAGGVGVRLSDGVAGLAGLVTCGSVWVCPVCSRKIAARRALEVGSVVAAAVSEGFTVVLVTLTLRHRMGQPLGPLWDAVSDCWEAATKGRPWRASAASLGLVGFTRSAEVTYGSNGWHPHTHALLIMRAGVTDAELEQSIGGLIDRWGARAVWRGLAAPLPGVQDWRRVASSDVATVTEYLSKTHKDVDPSTIGLELTHTQSKSARTAYSTRSMWEVLEGAVTLGLAADVGVWREFETASKGRRALVWSRGLRERFALAPEQSDEDIAAEELGSAEDTLVTITAEGWDVLARFRPALIPQILSVTEAGGWPALAHFLTENGIPWEVH
jgi:Replication protein